MKTMKCSQLGGACELEFQAETFDKMVEISKQHGKEMFQIKDADHLNAMNKIGELMQEPGAMKEWFENKRKEFDALPEN